MAMLLRIPPTFQRPPLAVGGCRVIERDPTGEQYRFYDTADLRLLRWGFELCRDGDGWLVTLPPHPSIPTSPTTRRIGGASTTPPAAAVELVRAPARGRDLGQIARVVLRIRTVELRDPAGAVQAVVDERELSVFDGRRLIARIPQVEIRGESPMVDAVVSRFEERGATRSEPQPLLRHAVGGRADEQADVVRPSLGGNASVEDMVRASLADATIRLVTADPYARLGEDLEGVHQARVATRRLRSDLRTYRDLLDPEWNRSLRDELKWLAGLLGTARDADVLRDRLAAAIGALPGEDRDRGAPLLDRIDTERAAAYSALRDGLISDRYLELLNRLVGASAEPALVVAAETGAREVFPDLVRGPWKHLHGDVAGLEDSPPDAALHAVRIRAKRARYAAEAASDVIGKPARRFARRAAQIQEVLGNHQDAVVAAGWLRDAAVVSDDVGAAYVAGVLAGQELQIARSLRDDWEDAWQRMNRKKVTGWL